MDTDQAIRALEDYRDNHCPLDSFLTSVLENDIFKAAGHADSSSWANLQDIMMWVHWEMPSNAWGSLEVVREWLNPTDNPEAPTLEEWRAKVRSGTCGICDWPLPSELSYRDHYFGWPVKGYARLQWLYLTCTNPECGHEHTLAMLGVPRPEVTA